MLKITLPTGMTISASNPEELDRVIDLYAVAVDRWLIVKAKRNTLLAETDWTQNLDAVLSIEEKAAWQEYRQALRDIPQDFANPEDVIWPVKPGGA